VLVPKLVTTLREYDRHQFQGDLVAGVVVGIVALPLAIAFAIASGVSPQAGLWTAIIAGFLVSALGGSRVQIAGPTGAFVVIIYGIVQQYGLDGLTVATLMAGVMILVMGLAGLGSMIKFIPRPLVTGFTSGIAVVILSSQMKDLAGLRMGAVPAGFVEKWRAFAAHAPDFTPEALLVSALALAIMIVWPRISVRIPGPLIALIGGTVVVAVFDLPVETMRLPDPTLPNVTWTQVRELVNPAFAIALLGAIESLLSAVVSDGMIGARHRSNMELVAQGVANIVTPLFGGIPATGALARTATNVKNGGRTPVAGIMHSVTLLLIALFFGQWTAHIPLAALAAILLVVAYHMSEWRSFAAEMHSPRSDIAVLLVTFFLTVLVDLIVAIEIGMVLAAFLFIRRMAEVANVTSVRALTGEFPATDAEDEYSSDPNAVQRRKIPKDVEVYEISGAFFFGAAEAFKETISQIARKPKVLIIRMRHVLALDSTGMHALKEVVERSRKEGTVVLLADIHMQPVVALTGTPAMAAIGEENLFGNLDDALNRAREILGLPAIKAPQGATPTVRRETPRGTATLGD
jgi:SulP family sulfate permease